MALIKSKIYSDIKGRIGGTVFKRDASGLHIIAKSRTVNKKPSGKTLDCCKWYAGHKRDERSTPDPRIPDEPPEDPGTFKVYSLHHINTWRDPSLFKPDKDVQPDDEEIYEQASLYIYTYWVERLQPLGVPFNDVVLIFVHYLFVAHWTWGVIMSECWSTATEYTIYYFEKAIAIGRIAKVAGWAALVAAAFIYKIGEFYSENWGKLNFNKWDMLIRGVDNVKWCGLLGRPSLQMYDVNIGPVLQLPTYFAWAYPTRDFGRGVYFSPTKLFQFVTSSAINWYTWTMDDIYIIYLGNGHYINSKTIRFQGDAFCNWFLNMPIGYLRNRDETMNYLANLHTLFTSGS